jgi:hypothetical protein
MAKRVFFSFHYQDVKDFRANVVRQSWRLQKREEAGFFDGSIWEESKTKGSVALKKLINDGLEGTSVTAVLIGSQTYLRDWVRYEIMKSFSRGNHLLGVHINQVKCKDEKVKDHGPNPFEYLAAKYTERGDKLLLKEWNGEKWIDYKEVDTVSLNKPTPQFANQQFKLSKWFNTYCWKKDDGYKNFSDWIG